MQDFRRLVVWEKAHQLTLSVHHAVQAMPRGKYAGLRSQILRAAASVSTNIAEGCGHRSTKELVRFVDVAIASVTELQYHLILARDLRLISTNCQADLDGQVVQVRRMLSALGKALRAQAAPALPVAPSTSTHD
ncbi:MAG: four helix bundle protein [Gemmatimonadota bacterium]|nr:four helix bundle protein [Gemmatimonadota bacterium]MDE3215411.1 four helix bundle protein [Gemmatimonadota bacterium]